VQGRYTVQASGQRKVMLSTTDYLISEARKQLAKAKLKTGCTWDPSFRQREIPLEASRIFRKAAACDRRVCRCRHGHGAVPARARIQPPGPAQTGATGNRIEVIEFFYYGCRSATRRSVAFPMARLNARECRHPQGAGLSSESWEPFAKLFYTLESLGEIDRLHWPVYDSFHFDGIKLNEESVVTDWMARNGFDRQKFVETYHSTAVAAKIAQARELIKAYNVRGVPTFVVDGKYVTSARLAGGTQEMIQTLDYLVKLARQERPQ